MSAIHGERLILEQENGNPVSLIVSGDEFYVRHETLDGFTVVYDNRLGFYCYATLVQGRFKSTEIPIHKRPPMGTRRHLQESPKVRAVKFEERFKHLYPAERVVPGSGCVNFTLGANNGLLSGRRVSEGNVVGLTILVQFQDVRADITAEHVDALLNGENYSANGNYCSVREYYQLVSNGKLNYRNRVVGPISLSGNRRYYETTPLMREALLAAIQEYDLDLAEFDSRNDGIVDAVSFMYAGRTVYGINGDSNNPSWLWPHNSKLNFQHNGISTNYYQISSLGRSPLELTIGTFCHESGHMLCRFPDLYDYGRRDEDFTESGGLSRYCLMSSGNHLNLGRTPAPICGYLRDLVGWPNKTIYLSDSGNYEVLHDDYGTMFKHLTDNLNEYFVVENRSKLGLNAYLSSSGLAVFHCDTEGSNEWQHGTAEHHYQCALLQADGRRDLENDRRGDATDLFENVPGVALSNNTLPSSREWDGSDSGFIIRNISAPGEIMTFNVGLEPIDPFVGFVSGEESPDLLIPDNKPEGVQTKIKLSGEGVIKSIKVSVRILHAYQGDIRLELYSPQGTEILLHKAHELPGNDLMETYDSATHEALRSLVEEPFAGEWTLHIKDLLAQDTGRLNHWRIEVEYESADKTTEKIVKPALKIPDNDPQGVSSNIQIDDIGILKDIEVTIDISHTFIRDLRVELVAPSGHSVFLHDRQGGGADNIKRDYDRISLPELDTLIRLPIQGIWMLRLKDLEGFDEGTLNAWSMKITYGSE
jgi:M6 family metalloprotease-like protein